MKQLGLFFLLSVPFVSYGFIRHTPDTDCMLVSLPRSGSSFLASMIEKSNSNVSYKSEQLTRQWGGLIYCQFGQEGALKSLYNKRFVKYNYNFTKEVYLSLYTGLFRQRFTVFALYRHRKHTFPSDQKVVDFVNIFNMFFSSSCLNQDICSIKDYVQKTADTDIKKKCAIHIVMNYILLCDVARYDMPVIEYSKLMSLDKQELSLYLEGRVPPQLFSFSLAKNIEENRFQDAKFLYRREQEYNSLGAEDYCAELVTFMKQINPSMPYWYLLE